MADELVRMSDQFQGLSMENLIGGPLTAACESQVMLARATAILSWQANPTWQLRTHWR